MRKPGGFPWGSNNPTRVQRLLVAATVAAVGSAFTAAEYFRNAAHHSDFGIIWFGARSMFRGVNPWPLVGPGLAFDWSWPLLYPGTALVLASPLTLIPESASATLFVFISVFLLIWGATRDSWNRLPAVISLPFVVASSAGQWSALLASTWFLPFAAVACAAKPMIGLSLLAGARDKKTLYYAAAGGIVLALIAFAFVPTWPQSWLGTLRSTSHMRAPITCTGGIAIALVLMCWRRPEAKFLFVLACMPQSPAIYDLLLILFIVPETYGESAALSLTCSIGLLLSNLGPDFPPVSFVSMRGMLNVAVCYLPATIVILRRPNEGPAFSWMGDSAPATSS